VPYSDAHPPQNPNRSNHEMEAYPTYHKTTRCKGRDIPPGTADKKGTRGGKGEAMLTASGLPMMLATALEASARMAEVSTPSRLTLVDTLRHGILGPRRFFLLLVAFCSGPAALFLRLCLAAGLLPLSISILPAVSGLRVTEGKESQPGWAKLWKPGPSSLSCTMGLAHRLSSIASTQ
jgi:hypothetical protein